MTRRTPALAALALLALSAPGAERADAAVTRIVAWGDSITAGYYDGTSAATDCTNGVPVDNPSESCGYPGRLGTRLDNAANFSPIYDVDLLNLGSPGEKTGTGNSYFGGTMGALSRIDRTSWPCPCAGLDPACPVNSLKYWVCNGTVKAQDLFVLLEGANDISKNISVETTAFNLGQIGGKAEALGLNVVISTLLPRHPYACVDPQNVAVEELNGEIDSVASTRSWPLIDLYARLSLFANLFENLYQDWDPMKCDPANETGVGDPVGHPNRTGFHKIAYEGAAANYPLTIEFTVRGALPPRLTLTPPSPPLSPGVPASFSVTLPDRALFGQTVALTWDFGDGTVVTQSVSSSPVAKSHTYATIGSYVVVVTAEHANGGRRSRSSVLDIGVLFGDGFESGGLASWEVGN